MTGNENQAAQIAETVIGMGVDAVDDCTLCGRIIPCPPHMGAAIAKALAVEGLLTIPDVDIQQLREQVVNYEEQLARCPLGVEGHLCCDCDPVAEIETLAGRIARAIQDASPPHLSRDYTQVDAAYDNAARIARETASRRGDIT